MRFSTHQGQDRSQTLRCFSIDFLLWTGALLLGATVRFIGSPYKLAESVADYLPSFILSGMVLTALIYVLGLYSIGNPFLKFKKRVVILLLASAAAITTILAIGSVNFSWQVGRGVLALGSIPAIILLYLHHTYLHYSSSRPQESAVILITRPEDEVYALLLQSLDLRNIHIEGCFTGNDYLLHSDLRRLGDAKAMEGWIQSHQVNRVYSSAASTHMPEIAEILRRLRYSGVAISDINQPCEENLQAIPVELIDTEWLINACSLPDFVYISKMKRAIDLAVCTILGIVLSPVLAVGIALNKLFSPGPVFYRQTRLGRFGKEFDIIKLRTMRIDAEAGGAQWSTENDPRVTPIGKILRKFRIDEIPQLWNVLVGEMSFIGPRPERASFAESLTKDIPYFNERLLIHPGLTGWAQVCYPYGSTVEDAKRKLEFDLYYMKNMGVILDVLVLLDTVKIIICGGSTKRRGQRMEQFERCISDACEQVTGGKIIVAPIVKKA